MIFKINIRTYYVVRTIYYIVRTNGEFLWSVVRILIESGNCINRWKILYVKYKCSTLKKPTLDKGNIFIGHKKTKKKML